jgi:hypothetical protein
VLVIFDGYTDFQYGNNARAFVFAHLQANPELKLADLEQLAKAQSQELSQSSISRYHKQFFASCASPLANNDASGESSAMQLFLASASSANASSGIDNSTS